MPLAPEKNFIFEDNDLLEFFFILGEASSRYVLKRNYISNLVKAGGIAQW
jgi:hypothetical protein